MKKLCAAFMALVLLMSTLTAGASSTFDMSVIRSNSELFTIDVNTDDEIAFVESTLTTSLLSFTHEDASDQWYSYSQFDMIVIDYFSSDAYPIMRLWLTTCNESQYYYFTSVTFTVGDTDYTFSDISDSEWFTTEHDYQQRMLIKFGNDNLEFLVALETAVKDLEEVEDFPTIKVVFHGTKDIETELGAGFLLDFMTIKSGYLQSNGINYISKANTTPMKTTEHAAEDSI